MPRTLFSTGATLFALLIALIFPKHAAAQDGQLPPESRTRVRESLTRRLTDEGFDSGFIRTLLHDERWELSLLVLEKNLIYRESRANYSHFLDTYSTALARDFLEKNRVFLEEKEKEYGVEKEVIVAILLIESSFGRHVEKYRVFNTLCTLSQAVHPEVFPVAFRYLKESNTDLTEAYLRKRARRKSGWAFQELKAFLEIGIRENLDIMEVRGSWAGAFGLPQFLPTSYLTYAVDGDGDNRVHLGNRRDAMASVANYLRAHGWKLGLSEKEMKGILFRYNRSHLYGETVLNCARKLKAHEISSAKSLRRAIRGADPMGAQTKPSWAGLLPVTGGFLFGLVRIPVPVSYCFDP
jgi:membrane-bound lytic murein transglycosylase B